MSERVEAISVLAGKRLERSAYVALMRAAFEPRVLRAGGFGTAAIWAALRHAPAVVVIREHGNAEEVRHVVQMIADRRPGCGLVVIADGPLPALVDSIRKGQLRGYVTTDVAVAELIDAVVEVVRGGCAIAREMQPVVERAVAGEVAVPPGLASLSRREAQLLPLLVAGLTLRQAAGQLGISPKTADTYRTNLFRKLNVHNRVALTRLALEQHLVDR